MTAPFAFEYRLRLSERERGVIVNALSVQIENITRHQAAAIDTDIRELTAVLALVAACEPYPLELIHCPYRRDCPWAKPTPL